MAPKHLRSRWYSNGLRFQEPLLPWLKPLRRLRQLKRYPVKGRQELPPFDSRKGQLKRYPVKGRQELHQNPGLINVTPKQLKRCPVKGRQELPGLIN